MYEKKSYLVRMHEAMSKPNLAEGSNENLTFWQYHEKAKTWLLLANY